MRKILVIMIMGTMLTMCTTPNVPQDEIGLTCELPSEFPDTLATGEKIEWDCDWEASYRAGNVGSITDDNGNVTMMYRKLSQ